MKLRDQTIISDGFDRNVAEKMPKVKKEEDLSPVDRSMESQWIKEEPVERTPLEREPEKAPEIRLEKGAEKRPLFSAPKPEIEREKRLDVRGLIEDLHTQLLVSSQTKRALETDLASSHKTIQQLMLDNKDLRLQAEELHRELKKLRDTQAETSYLREENSDALFKIQEFQQELKSMNEALAKATQEREEALSRSRELESQIEQTEVLRIRGKLKEKEASHFAEENRELRTRLEEAQLQYMELETEYEEVKRSFNEIKESLTFLRDSCKASYYNLSENAD